MSDPTGITISAVERFYDAKPILAGIELTVEPGECLALLGPSGCGKTTLLRLIAGLDPVDAGTIALGDRVVSTTVETVAPERRGVGMVFQDGALFPHLNVTRNVGFGLGRGERRGGATIDEMLELVGLAGYGERMPDELSGGEAQRVALARALAPSPGVLLLDEPFSNLDSVLRRRLRDDVRSVVRSAGVTTVLVTHDRDEAFRLGDRVAVMRGGVIAQVGEPRDLYQRPLDRWVAELVGETTWIDGVVAEGRFRCALGSIAVPSRRDGPASLLLRHEDLTLESRSAATVADAVTAVVRDVEFAGSNWQVTVELDAHALLVVLLPGDSTPPMVGATVRMSRRAVDPVLFDLG